MSGKLKLLPHKSWNVWNRDNRERVLKDKRLLQEENDIKSKREKELEQEHILTVLKSTASNTSNTSNTITTATTSCNILVNTNDNEKQLESFRLFDDIEEKLQKQKQNEDYKKEKEMKELLKQRREGTAPWGLGDGLHEKSKMKPWYISNDVKESSSSNEKDVDDKSRLDPMARFIIRDRYEYEYHQRHHDNNDNDKSKSSIPILSNINTIMGLSTINSNDDKKNKKHKKKRDRSPDDDKDRHKHKKEKKHKKHKHKHD